MQYLPNIPYPETEKPKLADLEKLFREWHQHFVNNGSELEKLSDGADQMVFDGFYPYYFSQKKRVLFIGREVADMYARNYIEDFYGKYRDTKKIGAHHIDKHKFYYRMTCIAYGILNGMPDWKDIPDASEIANTLGEANGLSFAFMNISKLSNQNVKSTPANWPLINAAYEHSIQSPDGRNFIREEIAILDPHIIITMKLEDKMVDALGDDECQHLHSSGAARSFRLNINGQPRLLIDPNRHFAAWTADGRSLDDNEDYYAPICDLIRRSEASS